MRFHLRGFALAALVVGSLVSTSAMKNEDVIKMTKAGLSETTIVRAIGRGPADFDASPDGLIALKNAGVSEVVIQKIVATESKGADSLAVTDAAVAGPGFGNEVFPAIAPPPIDIEVGKEYFLRCTIRMERGNYPMTNYARGEVIPINTPVRVLSTRGAKISLKRLDNGQEFTIENIPKHTTKSLAEVGRMMLAAEKTALDKLPAALAAAIRSGEMRRGMNKEQTIMARGYPPAHETASVESNRWVYWSSRFVKQTVVFNDDRLVEGRMIR
jgi:hypothetical protein